MRRRNVWKSLLLVLMLMVSMDTVKALPNPGGLPKNPVSPIDTGGETNCQTYCNPFAQAFHLCRKCPTCSDNFAGITMNSDGTFTVLPPCRGTGDNGEQRMLDTIATIKYLFFSIYGMSTMIAVVSLIYGAIQLAASAGNPHAKQKAWGRLKITIIVLACLGGLGVIVSIFTNILN